MKDTKFFEQALELAAPWKVPEVNMDVTAKKVEVILPSLVATPGERVPSQPTT